MDDFLLTMNCGYSSQDVIVGGESCIMDEIFCPDLKSFIQEEINLDDSEESSASVVSESDEGSMPSPGITADNEEMIKIKDETDDEDLESFSLNVETGDIEKTYITGKKEKKRQYIFVSEDGKTAECIDDLDLHHSKKEEEESIYTKPKMSYAQLIAEALLTGQDRMLTLNEIYIAVNKQHPYYSLDAATGRNWQNAIRHNLTLNKAFIKVPRPATEGRGAYWKLEAGAESQIFRRMARNYNRPKSITFTPRHNVYYCDNSNVKTVYITVPT